MDVFIFIDGTFLVLKIKCLNVIVNCSRDLTGIKKRKDYVKKVTNWGCNFLLSPVLPQVPTLVQEFPRKLPRVP